LRRNAHITTSQWISYSRNRNFYAGKQRYNGTDFTYATVTESVDRLAEHSLLENRIASNKGPSGKQSTFRATSKLIATAARPLVSAHLHELVVLRDGTGSAVDYQDTQETRQLRRNVAEINEVISNTAIGLDTPDLTQDGQFGRLGDALVPFPKTGLYRVFNGDFQNGGRHYGAWWQWLPKHYRAAITVNGKPTTETDYACLHPRLMYRLVDAVMTGDAYDVPGFPRPLCKAALHTIINARTRPAAFGAVKAKIAEHMAVNETTARKLACELIRAMKERHAPIAKFFGTGIGARLQKHDAAIAENVVIEMARRGVPALPIFDSFRVPDEHEGQLSEVMERCFSDAA